MDIKLGSGFYRTGMGWRLCGCTGQVQRGPEDFLAWGWGLSEWVVPGGDWRTLERLLFWDQKMSRELV